MTRGLKERLAGLKGALRLDRKDIPALPEIPALSVLPLEGPGLMRASDLLPPAAGVPVGRLARTILSGSPEPLPHRLHLTYGAEDVRLGWLTDLAAHPVESLPIHRLDKRLEPDALEGLLILDTETTGLSGGVGTLAFLIGIAWVEGGQFHVEQFLMRDVPDEPGMLEAVRERIGRASTLLSYNGKAFDVPLIDSRLVANRQKPLVVRQHLDLLFVSRKLWKRRVGACSLQSIERHLLDFERENDIPGHLIPHAYFRYIADGIPHLMERVLEHNRQDLLSLFGVLARSLDSAQDRTARVRRPPEDSMSLGLHLEKLGDTDAALTWYRETLATTEAISLRFRTFVQMGALLKKLARHDEARQIWERMVEEFPDRSDRPYVELSMHHERRTRDARLALTWTRRALEELSSGIYGALHVWPECARQLRKREVRLASRVERQERPRKTGKRTSLED